LTGSAPPSGDRIVLAHFIVSDDVERSRRFYTEAHGGSVVFSGQVTYVALANSFIINVGGGPTDDKPEVTREAPRDPSRVSSFLISGSLTSRPFTPSGAHGVVCFSRRPSSTGGELRPRRSLT